MMIVAVLCCGRFDFGIELWICDRFGEEGRLL